MKKLALFGVMLMVFLFNSSESSADQAAYISFEEPAGHTVPGMNLVSYNEGISVHLSYPPHPTTSFSSYSDLESDGGERRYVAPSLGLGYALEVYLFLAFAYFCGFFVVRLYRHINPDNAAVRAKRLSTAKSRQAQELQLSLKWHDRLLRFVLPLYLLFQPLWALNRILQHGYFRSWGTALTSGQNLLSLFSAIILFVMLHLLRRRLQTWPKTLLIWLAVHAVWALLDCALGGAAWWVILLWAVALGLNLLYYSKRRSLLQPLPPTLVQPANPYGQMPPYNPYAQAYGQPFYPYNYGNGNHYPPPYGQSGYTPPPHPYSQPGPTLQPSSEQTPHTAPQAEELS